MSPRKKIQKIEKEVKRIRRTYLYACGRRKGAIARVRYYKKGAGEISVNQKDLSKYFPDPELQALVVFPLEILRLKGKGNLTIKVRGGGKKSQAEAIRLGIARVLVNLDLENKKELKSKNLLTRDPRVKERKKYGLKRARRAPQWSKR